MTLNEIKTIIQTSIPDAEIHILDPMNDGQHLQAIVISPSFEGMPLFKQHQMVMKALKDALAGPVHAMGLKTFTPKKWQDAKSQFNIS